MTNAVCHLTAFFYSILFSYDPIALLTNNAVINVTALFLSFLSIELNSPVLINKAANYLTA